MLRDHVREEFLVDDLVGRAVFEARLLVVDDEHIARELADGVGFDFFADADGPAAEVRDVVPVVQNAVNRVVLLDEPLALPAVVYLAPRLLEFDYFVENSVGQRLVDVVVILAELVHAVALLHVFVPGQRRERVDVVEILPRAAVVRRLDLGAALELARPYLGERLGHKVYLYLVSIVRAQNPRPVVALPAADRREVVEPLFALVQPVEVVLLVVGYLRPVVGAEAPDYRETVVGRALGAHVPMLQVVRRFV